MYTLSNLETGKVKVTGLTRAEMEDLLDGNHHFHYEPDHPETITVLHKYSKADNSFTLMTMDEVREIRDKALRNSDWRMVSDYPETNQSDWEIYRKQLRNIPQEYNKVRDIIWPTKP